MAAPEAADLWPDFLDVLGAALGAEDIRLQLVRQGRLAQAWQAGTGQPGTGHSGAGQTGPGLASLEKMRNDRVYSQFDLPGTESAEPMRALRWAVGPDSFAALILQRSGRDFRAADAAQLSRLAPYLGPAMLGWTALCRERSRAALDRRLSQDLGAFWLRLTPSGRVIDIAPDLRDRLASLPALRLQPNGWLEFSDPAAALAFRQALATAQTGPAASGMVDLSRTPPLQMVIREDTLADERTLLAILRLGLPTRSLPVEHVAEYFGLSRSEARLTLLLCDGYSLRDAAVELGWTLETARSCSKQIFARMGAPGQPGVVRKVLGSAVWLR